VAEPQPTPKQPSDRNDALEVLLRLRQAGHVAYFAGGCVRDLLLGLPAKDFDVATDAPPERVRELFRNTQAVGAAFGVILVRNHGSQIEVATFRTDGDYSDGRRPDSVRFATAEEDAQRRDFTINGLFLDPVENKVIDYVGGQADLKAKVIRAIGDPAARFREDHLRLLRAVRFAARMEFAIEPSTAEAIRQSAVSLPRVSPERIADELRRILTPPSRMAAWDLLGDLSLWQVIFRGLPGDNKTTVFEVLAPGESISFALALAAAMLNIQAAPGDQISVLSREEITKATRLARTLFKISNDEFDDLSAILHGVAGLLEQRWTLAQRMRFMARPTSDDTRKLLAAIARAGFHQAEVAAIENLLRPLEAVDCAPPPFVTGDDLTAAGLSPGPLFKRVLEQVYDAQLEGRVTDKPSAMAMALGLAKTA